MDVDGAGELAHWSRFDYLCAQSWDRSVDEMFARGALPEL